MAEHFFSSCKLISCLLCTVPRCGRDKPGWSCISRGGSGSVCPHSLAWSGLRQAWPLCAVEVSGRIEEPGHRQPVCSADDATPPHHCSCAQFGWTHSSFWVDTLCFGSSYCQCSWRGSSFLLSTVAPSPAELQRLGVKPSISACTSRLHSAGCRRPANYENILNRSHRSIIWIQE